MNSNSNSTSTSKSQKVKDIVDVVHEKSKLKFFFGNTDDDDDDDDDVHIDHVSSSASPLSMKSIMCALIVISVTLVLHHWTTTTTTSTTSASPPLDTMLNQDIVLVDVQAQEQLPGKWCCPRDRDGCKAVKPGGIFNYMPNVECETDTLPNGTVCKPRIGGHCCADKTSSQYHWQYVWVGHKTGCLKSSF